MDKNLDTYFEKSPNFLGHPVGLQKESLFKSLFKLSAPPNKLTGRFFSRKHQLQGANEVLLSMVSNPTKENSHFPYFNLSALYYGTTVCPKRF